MANRGADPHAPAAHSKDHLSTSASKLEGARNVNRLT
jgi:hypothetical protein